MTRPTRDIVGWPDVPVKGQGVWIDGYYRNGEEGCIVALIYPVSGKTSNWREKRSLIVSRVREILPTAQLVRYGGGVAHFSIEGGSVSAFVSAYDATWRKS